MQNYKVVHISDKEDVYCNCCGEKIGKLASAAEITDDYLQVEKNWGYFSNKDLVKHSFNICESCYDKWISTFSIPVKQSPHTEFGGYSEEELDGLNKAYIRQLKKTNC